jgi:hypothetical protein
VIHLYAVTRSAPAIRRSGVAGAEVRAVSCGGLHAVVSDHPGRVHAERAAALAHAEVVEAVAETTPSLPVRFGADHVDEEALRRAVARDADVLSRRLEHVGDRVELVLRFAVPDEAEPAPALVGSGPRDAPGAGRAYLRERLAQERAAEASARQAAQRLRELTAELDPLVVDVRETHGARGPERSLLVARAERDRVRRVAERLAAEHGLVVGGPWAPYTFAAGDDT